ncbi:hypothetical protein HYV86_07125 [Candidatus Woesearchaeota archaeon]|nr:hypothetical protein [Candidatus Woesearchaeota archaeon]
MKHCLICDAQAKYKIKDTSDYYCVDCAQENFSDIDMLVVVEEEAQRLNRFIKEKLDLDQDDFTTQDQDQQD